MKSARDAYEAALEPHRDRAAGDPVGLANHLPMALGALASMGASPARLAEFAERYVARHRLGAMDDDERRMRVEAEAEIAERGLDDALSVALAPLWPAFGTNAFHAAIRAAYAVERDDAGEVAAALAAWRATPLPIDVTPAPDAPAFDARDALDRLVATFDALVLPARGFITSRMRTVIAAPEFTAALTAPPRAGDLPGLTLLVAAAFGASRNFVALHVMTGLHALATLLRFAGDRDAAVAAAWPSFAAAYVVAGAPALPDAEELDGIRAAAPADWDGLLAAAIASDDDHVVKVAYTTLQLGTRSGDAVYRWAASRYVPEAVPTG